MKKSTTFRVIPLFFLLAILVVSCVKDEYRETKTSAQPVLKSGSDFGLPIYMSKNTLIGEAEIYIENDTIVVNVLLNEGYMPSEAHLYAGENAPPSPAPGLFPYHWNSGDGYPISFVIDISEWWVGTSFDWYFALHLKIGNESAWLLPEEDGTNWFNNAGKPIGWGQYFLFGFEFEEEFQLLNLSMNAFESSCNDSEDCWPFNDKLIDVTNAFPEFTFCLKSEMIIDIASIELSTGLKKDSLNAFYSYGQMDNPFFYIKWDGNTHRLIDGARYAVDPNTAQALLIKNFTADIYVYTGELLSENDDTADITITFIFEQCP